MTPEAMARLHAVAFTIVPRPWTAAEFAALLAEPSAILVARPQGFALGRLAASEAEILTLAVEPQARRRGIATLLLAGFEATAAARGAEDAFLEVAETNDPARRLYARLGYLLAGRRPGYYRAPGAQTVSALVLRKRLVGPGNFI
jgi:[ribosomal protein S18]-alanine N-acetyltransferase